MNRFDHSEFERQFTEEQRTPRKRSHRKLIFSVSAVLVAAIVALVSAVSISAGTTEADTAVLTLAAPVQTEETAAPTGYVLTDVSDVVQQALPSVVSITSRSLIDYYGGFGNGGFGDGSRIDDIFKYFFGDSFGGRSGDGYYYYEGPGYQTPEAAPEAEPEESENGEETEEHANEVDSGMGSGTIISQNDTELLILTSYHVVEGSSSLYVTFVNDASVDGYVKAADASADIAIVAVPLEDIDEETLNSIRIATISTEEPEVGDGVVVIGNALGYGTSVTTGIVSALNREIMVEGMTLNVIQTDAAINFGNSGGCMLNAKGEIIGISEAKATISYVEGMCYAIPVASNLELIQTLLNSDEVLNDPSTQQTGNGAFLGIRGRDVTEDLSGEFEMPVGVYVSSVVMGSGAEEAGIQSGDIIVGIDGKDITTMQQLQYELAYHEAGDTVTLSINRLTEGTYEVIDIEVTLTDRIS
ncbi:MAG: trypsin-like peptidase domain-containing protein [Parasporobacterium sp.]|nr:trypsin-like peptidase domain-containing protein [Parasporobacterium sp.]